MTQILVSGLNRNAWFQKASGSCLRAFLHILMNHFGPNLDTSWAILKNSFEKHLASVFPHFVPFLLGLWHSWVTFDPNWQANEKVCDGKFPGREKKWDKHLRVFFVTNDETFSIRLCYTCASALMSHCVKVWPR